MYSGGSCENNFNLKTVSVLTIVGRQAWRRCVLKAAEAAHWLLLWKLVIIIWTLYHWCAPGLYGFCSWWYQSSCRKSVCVCVSSRTHQHSWSLTLCGIFWSSHLRPTDFRHHTPPFFGRKRGGGQGLPCRKHCAHKNATYLKQHIHAHPGAFNNIQQLLLTNQAGPNNWIPSFCRYLILNLVFGSFSN